MGTPLRTQSGTLFLVPTGLGGEITPLLPQQTVEATHRVRYFVAENPKSARAFLKAIGHPEPLQQLTIETLDEHTPAARIPQLLSPMVNGADAAILSEAGCPAVADPGSALVRAAHEAGISVVPLVGPSAILLALMASGLNGQQFQFHGYLPIDRAQRAARIRMLEQHSEAHGRTQIFIEAPYRNDGLMSALTETCREDTLLCVAVDLTTPEASVQTRSVEAWRLALPRLDRRPAVFLIWRPAAGAPSRRRQKR